MLYGQSELACIAHRHAARAIKQWAKNIPRRVGLCPVVTHRIFHQSDCEYPLRGSQKPENIELGTTQAYYSASLSRSDHIDFLLYNTYANKFLPNLDERGSEKGNFMREMQRYLRGKGKNTLCSP